MIEDVLKAVVAIATLTLLLILSILLGWALIMLFTLVPYEAMTLGIAIFCVIIILTYIVRM